MRELRSYQREACDAVRTQWESGVARTVIVLPTGAGKTDCIAHLATAEAAAGGRVLILAHRSELLDQISERCRMHAPTIPVGRVQGARNQHHRPIVAATVQTLARERRQARMLRPALVIVDEVHHVASPSYVAVLRWAGCFDGTARMFGVTATLSRADKRSLGDVIESVAFVRDIAWGIEQGWLVRPHGRVVVGEHLDLNAAKVSRGDYVDAELGELVSQDVDQIVKAWLEHAAERPTVAFCPTVASAQALAEEFRAQGITTGEVYGATPPTERDRIFRGVTDGTVRVLVNVMVATEGLDLPVLSCALIARPTKVQSLYAQMVGRILRPAPGKTSALVLDVVGASHTQRLVTLVDLHKSAVINRDALDLVPCEECGGYVGRRAELVVQAEAAGLEPCECPPAERERDPDGGRLRLEGPATYKDVDLFAGSELVWLRTRGGLRFLPAGDRLAVLWPDSGQPDSPTWSVGHVNARGPQDGAWLDDHVPHALEEATALAEAWALGYDSTTARRTASWRTKGGRGSDAQLRYAATLGIERPERFTRARLSDEISVVLASRRLDR